MSAFVNQAHRAFGQRVRRIRRSHGVTQADLADAIGLSRTQVTNIEAGRSGVTIGEIILLCAELECSPDDLLGWTTAAEDTSAAYERGRRDGRDEMRQRVERAMRGRP